MKCRSGQVSQHKQPVNFCIGQPTGCQFFIPYQVRVYLVLAFALWGDCVAPQSTGERQFFSCLDYCQPEEGSRIGASSYVWLTFWSIKVLLAPL